MKKMEENSMTTGWRIGLLSALLVFFIFAPSEQ
jgi:hypothetical protein